MIWLNFLKTASYGGGGGGSGYITQYNLNLYESLTELRVEVPSSTYSKFAKVSLAEASILLDQTEAGGDGNGRNGGNGYSGGGCGCFECYGCHGCYGSNGGSDGSSGFCTFDDYLPGQGSGLNISELRFRNFELR